MNLPDFRKHVTELLASVEEGPYANTTVDEISDTELGVETPDGSRFLVTIEAVDD